MDSNGKHHVARMDDTVTPATLHERAEAVAVPDFNYVEQMLESVVIGPARGRHAAEATPGDDPDRR